MRRQSYSVGSRQWRRDAEALWRYMRRDMSDFRAIRAARYPETHGRHVVRTVSFIYRLSRELSTLYLKPPFRVFEGLGEDKQDLIRNLYERLRVDRAMRGAQEQMAVLQNATIWLWPKSNGRLSLIVPPVHRQRVETSEEIPTEVEDVDAWEVDIPIAQAYGEAYATARITKETAVWIAHPDQDKVGRGCWSDYGTANPFGRIPVVILRACDPDDGSIFAPVPQDLLDTQRGICHDATNAGQVREMQGFGQPVIKGVSANEAKKMVVGPEHAIGLEDPSGDFFYAQPGADLDGASRSSEDYLKLSIAMNGLNPATVVKSAGITALAKLIEIYDRDVERTRAAEECIQAEQEIFFLISQWLSVQLGGATYDPKGVRVKVTYLEPPPPSDPTSEAQANTQNIALAVESSASIVAQKRGIPIAEAQEIVKENIRLQRDLEGVIGYHGGQGGLRLVRPEGVPDGDGQD